LPPGRKIHSKKIPTKNYLFRKINLSEELSGKDLSGKKLSVTLSDEKMAAYGKEILGKDLFAFGDTENSILSANLLVKYF
jgi:hypothetical protein